MHARNEHEQLHQDGHNLNSFKLALEVNLPWSTFTVKDPPAEDSQAYCSSSLFLVMTTTFSATR